MSKKAAWYSKLPPILIVLVILTVLLILSGQASLQNFAVLVTAVVVGSALGAMTVAWYEQRKKGS